GLLVPEPVRARSGEWLVHDDEDVWRAWKRVPRAAPAGEVTPATVREAGRLLGRFHAALADIAPTSLTMTLPGFHDPGRRLSALRDAIDADPRDRVAGVTDEIEMALAG